MYIMFNLYFWTFRYDSVLFTYQHTQRLLTLVDTLNVRQISLSSVFRQRNNLGTHSLSHGYYIIEKRLREDISRFICGFKITHVTGPCQDNS